MNNVIDFLQWDWPKRLERLRSYDITIKKEDLELFIRWWYDLFLLLKSYEFLLELNLHKWYINCFIYKYIKDLFNLRFEYSRLNLNPNDFGLTENLLNNYV